MPPKKNATKNKVGRPQLPPSGSKALDERRKYYREYNRKRRQEILGLAAEFNKDEVANKLLKTKHQKCTEKVTELVKKLKKTESMLDRAHNTLDDIIKSYDRNIAKIQKRGKGIKK